MVYSHTQMHNLPLDTADWQAEAERESAQKTEKIILHGQDTRHTLTEMLHVSTQHLYIQWFYYYTR